VYAAAGFDRVVVDYVMECAEHYDRFLGALPADLAAGTRLFTLWAPLAVVTARESTRPGRDRLEGRVADCWSAIQTNLDTLGTVIDADRPVDEVLADLEDHLRGAPMTGSTRDPGPDSGEG